MSPYDFDYIDESSDYSDYIDDYIYYKTLRGDVSGIKIVKGDNGLLGYICSDGRMVTDFIFEEANEYFDDLLTKVKLNGKYRLLEGLKDIIAEFDFIGDCGFRFVKVMNNGKWGFFDQGTLKQS